MQLSSNDISQTNHENILPNSTVGTGMCSHLTRAHVHVINITNRIRSDYEAMTCHPQCQCTVQTPVEGVAFPPNLWKIFNGKWDLRLCILKAQVPKLNEVQMNSAVQLVGIGSLGNNMRILPGGSQGLL